jgi:hypothetical protein
MARVAGPWPDDWTVLLELIAGTVDRIQRLQQLDSEAFKYVPSATNSAGTVLNIDRDRMLTMTRIARESTRLAQRSGRLQLPRLEVVCRHRPLSLRGEQSPGRPPCVPSPSPAQSLHGWLLRSNGTKNRSKRAGGSRKDGQDWTSQLLPLHAG